MSYEKSKSYREYALIQGINLLVNMVDRIKEEKISLKEIHEAWIESGMLSFGNQIELIFGTAADRIRCRYMAFCINEFNSYMMSKYPKHRGLMRNLTKDILNSINMAVFGNAHIWSKAQLQSIEAAFMSGRVAKSTPYYEPPPEEEEEEGKKNKKHKVLEYTLDRM